jgi:ArsR family transcriptional regulator, arsenate/arsenite/antimonite-responsive transcriptional repressor
MCIIIDTFASMNMKLDLKKIEKISKALGDPYRLKIMEMIKKRKECTQCTTIVETVDLAQSTVSHHIKQLIDADLLVAEKDGRNARYHINQEVLDGYIKYLTQYKS